MSTRRNSRGLLCLVAMGVAFALIAGPPQVAVLGAAQSLPSPWASVDIGAPPLAGSTSGDGASFQIAGSGADIWDTSDQFQFAYQPLAGDATITAQITSVDMADAWSKAGVMIRASLSPDAPNALMFISAAGGRGYQSRSTAGAATGWAPGCYCGAPGWVRLVRKGNLLTAYESSDGSAWREVGSDTVAMPATVYVGLGVTSRTGGALATATFTNVSVTGTTGGTTPPGPIEGLWTALDLGLPLLGGSFSNLGGLLTVRGGGSDIWGLLDQFHYVSQAVTGDTQIVARIASLDAADTWSKAGIMIRGGLTSAAPNAAMMVSGGAGWDFQRRLKTSGLSYYTFAGWGGAPGWVKLTRQRDLFTAYRSQDGVQWTFVGSEVIAMPETVYVGLAVASHDPLALATATFSDVTIGGPTATNQPPSVQLSAPSSASAPATIAIGANASDPDGSVTRVDFYANGQLLTSDTSSPFAATWPGVPAGIYLLTAVATDDGGATAVSGGLTISVGAVTASQPTTVVFTPPFDYSTNVSSMAVELRRAGEPSDAAPVGAVNLGKPSPSGGEIAADITGLVNTLPGGSYYVTIVSSGPGGSTASEPSAAFSK